jgi:hypothetical protein
MSVTSSTSGAYVTMNWSVASTITVSGLTFNFDHVQWTLAGYSNPSAPGAGSTGAELVGYSTAWSGSVTAVYKRSGHSDQFVTESISGTTGPQPVTGQSVSISGSGSNDHAIVSFTASCSGGTVTAATLYQDGVSVYSNSGSLGSSYSQTVDLVVGYNASHNYQATATFSDGSSATSAVQPVVTGSPPGPPPSPPPAPPDVTNLSGVINGSGQAVLNWTGSASGYTVYRHGSAIGSTTGAPFTDTSTPTARPVSYYVVPYNTGSGGTTNGNPSNTVTFSAITDSAGILIG